MKKLLTLALGFSLVGVPAFGMDLKKEEKAVAAQSKSWVYSKTIDTVVFTVLGISAGVALFGLALKYSSKPIEIPQKFATQLMQEGSLKEINGQLFLICRSYIPVVIKG